MSIPTPDELKKTTRVSYGLLVAVFAGGLYLGGVLVSLLGLDTKLQDELGGLRSDMNREVQLLREQIEGLNSRIDRKVQNHEKLYHKDK